MAPEVWADLRNRRGTVKRIAEGLGISAAAVSQWRQIPSARVARVAEILNVTVGDLLPSPDAQPTKAPEGAPNDKTRATLLLEAGLLNEAVEQGVDVSATAERALRDKLAQLRGEQWLAENREAIEATHRFIEENGLWSDGLRQF